MAQLLSAAGTIVSAIIGAAAAAIVVFAIVLQRIRKKQGKGGCGCDCSSCCGGCSQYKREEKKDEPQKKGE